MTASETTESQAHLPPQRKSSWEILGRAGRLYAKNGTTLTRPLIWPVVQMVLGTYSSQTLSLWLLNQNQSWLLQSPWLAIGLMALISLLSVGLILRGGWQYMMYWGSLCLNAWEAETGEALNIQRAYQTFNQEKQTQYAILACAYFSLPALTFVPLIALTLLGAFLGPNMLELLMIAGFLQSLILAGLWTLSLIPLSFIFQIAAFENGLPNNPLHTFKISCKLTLKQFWKTLVLQISVFLITNIIIPQPLVWLVRWTRLSAPLDGLHHWVLQQTVFSNEAVFSGVGSWQDNPLIKALLPSDFSMQEMLAQTLSDLCLSCIITLILLPFGTLVFTLLYKDILKCDRSKKTWLGI